MKASRILAISAPVLILALLYASSWRGGEARESAAELSPAAEPAPAAELLRAQPRRLAEPLAAAAQQQPPAAIRHPRHVPVGGRQPPGGVLTNPFKGSAAAAQEGERIFGLFNCDGCHGDGGGAVGPSLADGRFKYGSTDEEIFFSIYYGRPLGMPAYGGTLDRNGIWRLVTFIQSLAPTEDISTLAW